MCLGGGGGQNKKGGGKFLKILINRKGVNKTRSGKFLKILINGVEGGIKINKWWGFSKKFNATKQGSHDTTGCVCCGVRVLVGNFTPKMHACKHI